MVQLNGFSRKTILILIGVILVAGFLVLVYWLSRGDWVYPTQPHATTTLALNGASVGQTFVAEQAGLQGIGIKVAGEPISPVTLQLRLFANPSADKPLIETTANALLYEDGQYVYFQFPPQTDSRFHYYYFTVNAPFVSGKTQIKVFGADLNTYINGSAYIDDNPFEGQLAFHLNYERRAMAVAFAQNVIAGIPAALATIVMLFIPGGALLTWLRPKLTMDGIEWLAMTVGVSLAVIPVLLTYLRYVPMALNSGIVWGGYGVATMLFLWGTWRDRAILRQIKSESHHIPAYVAFVIVFLVSLVVRLQVVTGLEIPLWGDSYHHTIIAQLIVDNGKIVSNWEPYAPLTSLNYHYGFHAMVAIFHWLTGLTVPKSVVFFGQILNVLAVLMAYLLGKRLGNNTWVGVIAALIVGLLSKYPMYYVNWGRYTQLAGQILLPSLIVLTWEILQRNKRDWRLIGFNILLIGSLFLTHYRVILFYPAFIIPQLLITLSGKEQRSSVILSEIFVLIGMAISALIIISPRVVELFQSKLWEVSEISIKQGLANDLTKQVLSKVGNIFDFQAPLVILLGWIGFGYGGWKHRQGILTIGGWWLFLLLLANPQWLHLPGVGQVTNFAVFISAYLIFSVLAGFAIGSFVQYIINLKSILRWGVVCVIIFVSLWGGEQQLQVLDRSNILVTIPDLRAMKWVEENIPKDAVFYVNSELAYFGSVVVGTDAGWWLPYLAHRKNTVPPMEYSNESWVSSKYAQFVIDMYHELSDNSEKSGCNLSRALTNTGVEYIYIGQQRGTVFLGPTSALHPERLVADPCILPIYSEDGVRIFKIVKACISEEMLCR